MYSKDEQNIFDHGYLEGRLQAEFNMGFNKDSIIEANKNLRCCGNCYYRTPIDDTNNEYCPFGKENNSWNVCNKWHNDEMTINQRHDDIELINDN